MNISNLSYTAKMPNRMANNKAVAQYTASGVNNISFGRIESDFSRFLKGVKFENKAFLSESDIVRLAIEPPISYTPFAFIENFPNKVVAVLSNPEELSAISLYKDKVRGIFRSVCEPLGSTVKANRKLYPFEYLAEILRIR